MNGKESDFTKDEMNECVSIYKKINLKTKRLFTIEFAHLGKKLFIASIHLFISVWILIISVWNFIFFIKCNNKRIEVLFLEIEQRNKIITNEVL